MSNKETKHLIQEGGFFMRPLFEKLNSEHIRYSVLRNYESLPNSTGGSDVDMWVHIDDLPKCEVILKTISKDIKMPLVSFYDAPSQYKVCYMGVSDGVQFDIFKGDIYWKNWIMFSGESIWANTIDYNGVRVLNDEFADIMTIVKEIINTNNCRQKYIDKVYTTDVYTKQYLQNYLELFGDKFLSFFAKCLKGHTINENLSLLGQMSRQNLSRKKSLSKIRYKLSKLRRLFKKPGFTICVEGTDGSGKSFIIEHIEPMLNGAFHNHVTYNHLRPNVLPDIGILLKKRVKDENQTVTSNPHANKPSGFVMSLIRLFYYLVDYTFGYMKSVMGQIYTRTHVFIFDRYYYDYYIDMRRAHMKLPSWIVRLFEVFVPKPDIILCLGGDPAKIYARKPETSLEEVTRQTTVLKHFCDHRKNAFWIDTTQAPEQSINDAMKAILSVMSKRFENLEYTSPIK